MKFEKRYSRHTLTAYETDLIHFFDYLETAYGGIELSHISHTHIRSWLVSLKEVDLSAKSMNRKISTLKSFFKFQIRSALLQTSPMLKVIAPKNEKRLPAFVSGKDMKKLFEVIHFEDSFPGHTEKMILSLFYQTGIRVSELTGLKLDHVNLQQNHIKVLGKGNKERIIPLNKELAIALKAYSDLRYENIQNDLPQLFITLKGKAYTSRQVYSIVKKYLDQVTTISKRSPHILRHTFATHLADGGADLNAIKELLGHTSLAATQVYTHNTIDKLKNIYKNAHPKA